MRSLRSPPARNSLRFSQHSGQWIAVRVVGESPARYPPLAIGRKTLAKRITPAAQLPSRKNLNLEYFVLNSGAFALRAINRDIILPPKFAVKHAVPFNYVGQ